MYYIRVAEGKFEKMKKKERQNKDKIQYTLPIWRCTQTLRTLAPLGAEKSVTEISIGEKQKGTTKGTDKQYVAVFCYTIQLITFKLGTKFQNYKWSSCWEIFDRKNVHMYYIRATEGKSEKLKKESKIRISIFISINTIHFAYLKVCTKFHNPKSSCFWENRRKMSHMCYKGMTEFKIEKMQNED